MEWGGEGSPSLKKKVYLVFIFWKIFLLNIEFQVHRVSLHVLMICPMSCGCRDSKEKCAIIFIFVTLKIFSIVLQQLDYCMPWHAFLYFSAGGVSKILGFICLQFSPNLKIFSHSIIFFFCPSPFCSQPSVKECWFTRYDSVISALEPVSPQPLPHHSASFSQRAYCHVFKFTDFFPSALSWAVNPNLYGFSLKQSFSSLQVLFI